ncbi:MAG: glycoside hydrolase family 99-like domain-containing protein [Hyphomonas sp.]|nr:glycoside hydrolase family 99-like domain-containing protein [Hyphomonas sp.]
MFRNFPFLVSWSATYRNWKAEEDRLAEARRRRAMRPLLESGEAAHAELSGLPRPASLRARAIAFYLPQFHPIPENDAWWGEGFTEWTNVRRAKPQFEGHDQPARPGELGYYDLLKHPQVRRRQATLAHQYGLEAFCFYFYWFGGKRLLEAPIEQYAEDDAIDFPFCLCWANEPWSRTWDGREQEVLMAQHHSPDDDIAFISYLARYLRNPKYLRVIGRPLVMVYRPGLLPDAKATAERWRGWCRDNGVGEIYLVCTQSFDTADPAAFGFDAATEFPPNNMGLEPEDGLVDPVTDDFQCKVYDWSVLPKRAEAYADPGYKLFRGVTPRWDNTARRMNRGTIFVKTDPDQFTGWVRRAADDVAARFDDPSERLVFVNAWNEWAEGACLEPDLTHGYVWLEALRRGLQSDADAERMEPAELVHDMAEVSSQPRRKIIVAVHDLHRHGAQFLSLNFVATLRNVFGYEVSTIAGGDGSLAERFSTYGRLYVLPRGRVDEDIIRETVRGLEDEGYTRAIVNSSASAWLVPYFAEAGIECIGLVHELPELIRTMHLEPALRALDRHARQVVFASTFVEQRTAKDVLGHDWAHPVIAPQGLYKRDGIVSLDEKELARQRLCAELGLPETSRIVVGVGYGDRRKGVDRFCLWGVAAAKSDRDVHFVWVGNRSKEMERASTTILAEAGGAAENIHFVGFQSDTGRFYAAASAFALTSREDPYPSTAIEALDAGTPVFTIAGTGGVSDLAGSSAVVVLPDGAPEGFATALMELLRSPDAQRRAGAQGLDIARTRFGFRSFVGDMLRLLGEPVPKISVIVPNYNYARHLPHRLGSILNQSIPVWEIIFLDDASTDDSVCVAQTLLHNCSVRYRVIRNESNSGSVFAQWKKGVDLAEGDIIWIAEADDWAARDFLEVAAMAFTHLDVAVSYTQSNQVSEEGAVLSASYLDYVQDVDAERWRKPFINEGVEELTNGLSVKNTLPNVSAVLLRRTALKRVLDKYFDEVSDFRVAGDWCVYTYMAEWGRIAYDPRPLNYHRRHPASVTLSRFTKHEWDEIRRMQEKVASMVAVPANMQQKAADYLALLEDRLDRKYSG